AAVEARIARLTVLRDELRRMLDHCASDTIAACRVIEVLGDHRLCAHDHGATEADHPT
ncbi:MerR family transcriptional regulator, partial [Paracoccus sp. PXZ]